VVVVLGPGADETVVDHTRRVLNHYGIPFTQINWREFEGLLASGTTDGLQVVVFETGTAYTDEQFRPEAVVVPVLLVRTAPAPSPGEALPTTPFIALMGYGVSGAIDAGEQAARILARNNTALSERLKRDRYPRP
jgi:hypothetical protein